MILPLPPSPFDHLKEVPPLPAITPDPPPNWYTIARGYIGTKEVVGKGSNPTIMSMAARVGGWVKSFFKDDDIPWCALFVNNCLLEAGIKGTGQSLAALDFAKWGMVGPLTVGAILVFKRDGGGHVGFYVGEKVDGTLRVLGGNQANAVNDTWIAKGRLVAVRWPVNVPYPNTGRVMLQWDGQPVSHNEA
jgi:uncharacterized protein (TIGR02594 family)